LRFVGRCYGAHLPAWSFTPLSGAGAASTGGRFNRKGEATLYLSLNIMTSVGECIQGFTSRLQPLAMCEYDVDCAEVADLHDETSRSRHGVTREELDCLG
jgi:RES domain-containing protein